MKTLLLILFFPVLCFGQTNIISNRSHHGELAEAHLETDNFGLPAPMIDSIIYIGGTCIVEATSQMGATIYYDTVCDHSLFLEHDFDLKEIKKHYSTRVKFIGFENYPKQKDQKVKTNRRGLRLNQVSTALILLLVFLFIGKQIEKLRWY